ncbi:PLP-dependent aspartate aminotransferase family protein [Aureisphaera sp. CAU 1614]|uniref:PLP-dependent aspartate aminotransferase family protein n=1 Tax=Halomarinibacterium sedimenti TaxID=2857106 RepID=A0A9X1FP94_9FLAO|nr:PLP-dependent aspartate aminotransferase family protein [Halomarinibacterium sedimenti]MBW2938186.1 PLP-dependent aspartate aminotransferase family protein [Halomarinibacterium sedimenti]
MKSKKIGVNTICTHVGEIKDEQFKGAISPLYMSSSYAYENVDIKRYPRYFNTPNQEALGKKIAALEHCEAGMIFGSGMAAVSTALLAFLQSGDHVVVQKTIYGGAYNFMVEEFPKYNIEFDFTDGFSEADFASKIKPNTKVIYVETPSNPLMLITDLEMISKLAKKHQLVSMIDNTFASPINQNPADFGIDIIIHSATKYMGGHSDICAGTVAASKEHMDKIWNLGKNLGGSLSDYTVWLLERSIKTMGIRVKAQNRNAKKMAKWLDEHPLVSKVYYPGLKSHPDYKIARRQMYGFTGMLSFELVPSINPQAFMEKLLMIKQSMSLAGVESTILSPSKTSHALLSAEERKRQGIAEGLLRFSVGIEDKHDLIADLEQAFEAVAKKQIQKV